MHKKSNLEPEVETGLKMQFEGSVLTLFLSGDWLFGRTRPAFLKIKEFYETSEKPVRSICLDGTDLGEWDTALLIFVKSCREFATENNLKFKAESLPEGVRKMVDLSFAVPEAEEIPARLRASWPENVGRRTIQIYVGVTRYFDFVGRFCLDMLTFITGRSQLRRRDFLELLQATGPQALGIVSLLSFLMGLIVAFVGLIQLQNFGADIYVADLVGVAMTRELAAVMLGVIMAGRTGAAYAAQIGSMQVNEEVNALVCFGISPMQFLVLPRIFALILMMPLLCACADLISIIGGMVVAVGISDLTWMQYINEIKAAVSMSDFLGGIFKSVVFGVIIGIAGCYRGLNSGKDASAVGYAATSAVVTAITWIVIVDAIFAVSFQILGI
jgi:phospholipid/cholesterol/gamma-HCH transport system permease protein